MLADAFARVFREEHREIRDALFAVIEVLRDRGQGRVVDVIGKTAALTGPHFRFEEEALCPSLVEIFGEAYSEKLLVDHDRAIGTANALVELAGKDDPSAEDSRRAADLVRAVLPHVSDCDGLSIVVETLPEERVRAVMETRASCNREGLDLMRWASEVRERPFARI